LSSLVQNAGCGHCRRTRLRDTDGHGQSLARSHSAIDTDDHSGRQASHSDRMPRCHRHRALCGLGAGLTTAARLGEAAGGRGAGPRASQPVLTPAELIARIESVPFTRWHVWPRVIMGSATFFDAFTALSLASAMPRLVGLWHLSTLEVGLLLGPAS